MRDAWKNWPVLSGLLGVVAVSAIGFAYWSNVQDRERYLQSRNFRLLAVLASQTEQLLENRTRVFGQALAGRPRTTGSRGRRSGSEENSRNNPAMHELLSGGDVVITEPVNDDEIARYQTRLSAQGSALRFEWLPPGSDVVSISVAVPATESLSTIFDPKLEQGAFDTVLLSDMNGRVVYAAGRRAGEVRAISVAALLPTPVPPVRDASRVFGTTISEERVHIAGVEYRMFMQPCCHGSSSASKPTGFVVMGLVESQAMIEAALAISPVLVLAGAVLVLALLVGWTFLKVALLGKRQRVTRIDVLQLGASGIFGLALATILLLTSSTYARLSADTDGQLEALADQLDARMTQEVRAAGQQLYAMRNVFQGNPCVKETPVENATFEPCKALAERLSARQDLPDKYKGFTVFALLDTSGIQRIKVAFTSVTQRRLDVSERPYFHLADSGEGLWKLESCPDGCVLESHWSWTTGKPQVVLSTPTDLDKYPVAALSIPMSPLLEPVRPPGFEFAVIDQNGLVQFHSDTERNVHENLLLETDQNRRLRSLVTTHGAGTVNTMYWGRPYRAYVRPTIVPGWSIVALHAKQPARALVLEWAAVAILMQSAYTLFWILLTLVLMASDASWLWPDPLRRPWYGLLAIAYGASLIVWLLLATFVDRMTTVWTGLLMPPALWALTALILTVRPNDTGQAKGWSDLRRDYRLAAALMLGITAAVPAASFFTLAAGLHLDAYLKQQDIVLAGQVQSAVTCPAGEAPPPAGQANVRYDDVFYGSQVSCAPAARPEDATAPERRKAHLRFEDYLPYFTSASVALRELMHDRADDDAWMSERREGGKQRVTVRVDEPRYRLAIESPLLPVLGVRSLGNASRFVWAALAPLLLLAAIAFGAYWVVGYLLRRVVLADVVEPMRTNGHVVTSPGQNVLVICDDPAAMARELKDVLVFPLMPIVAAPNVSNAWRKARRAVSDVGPLQRIVIPDLDEQSDDVGVMRRKLELLEELMAEPDQTVILLSRMSKKALASSVRDSWKWSNETERWSRALGRLSVINVSPAKAPGATAASSEAEPATWWCELRSVVHERIAGLKQWWAELRSPTPRERRDWRKELLHEEGSACKSVKPFCDELRDTQAFETLTEDQVLEELEEHAGSIYRGLWMSCDEDERIVLEHVAQHGLASTAARRVVRRLLARGLLRKDPELRVMNRSFRRYILESERRQEVVVLERQARPSLWDRLRMPLGLGALVCAAFLAATQREAFDATLTMAVSVTTAVPALMKLAAFVTQLAHKDAPGEAPKSNV